VTGKISGTVVRDTAATGAPGALSDLAGYVFDAQGTQHVVYIGPNAGRKRVVPMALPMAEREATPRHQSR
jgi:hypothetical protein